MKLDMQAYGDVSDADFVRECQEAVASEYDSTGKRIIGSSNEEKMQALRDICAGKLNPYSPAWQPTVGVECLSEPNRAAVLASLEREIPICGKTWWEDGNHYECLMDKGHKELKHGLRGMVRVID